jgi:glycerate kinase
MKYFCIDDLMENCDLVIAVEGGIDYPSAPKKDPSEGSNACKEMGAGGRYIPFRGSRSLHTPNFNVS